jgi:hypothetical protein
LITDKESSESTPDVGTKTPGVLILIVNIPNKPRIKQYPGSIFESLLVQLAQNPKNLKTPLFFQPESNPPQPRAFRYMNEYLSD